MADWSWVVSWRLISGFPVSTATIAYARGRAGPLLLLAWLSGAAPATADDLVMRGSAIAAQRCGKCHAVGATDDSPHKITPPLRDLAADYPIRMLTQALETGIVGGHDEMPQFDLGSEGARALVAYIDSLNPSGPHYLKDRR